MKTSQNSGFDTFTAIAHPIRREILDMLAAEETTVNVLARPFDISRPAVSQHLRVLRDAGLVDVSRLGREQRYRLQPRRLVEVYEWAERYERFWTEKLDALGSYLEETK